MYLFVVHVLKQKKINEMHPHTDKYNANTYEELILKGSKNNVFFKTKKHINSYK